MHNIRIMGIKAQLRKYRRIFIVCDRNVASFAGTLGNYPIYYLEASEENKNMDGVLGICRWLLEQDADRQALLLSVGGGITSDMAGFAASIYKRGIRYANIPTTLLAMVDAGLGGKTGVNLDSYKNILGVIRQPEFTAICPEVLASLPEREMRSGLAEMAKSFVIGDARSYSRLMDLMQKHPAPLESREGAGIFVDLIQKAAAIKEGIVEKDEFERGPRRKLNLGHTWAHAIEWWQKQDAGRTDYTHGEAVAIGMVQAARKSEELGIAEPGLSERLKRDLSACGLPTDLPCPEQELIPAMHKDKKATDSAVAFVLPVRIGRVIIRKLVF